MRLSNSSPRKRSAAGGNLAVAVCSLFLPCILPGVAAAESKVVDAYFAKSIWPGDGPAIADAVLVVSEGKVIALGGRAEIQLPADAREHELGSVSLIPGLVVAQTGLVESTRDPTYAITPEVRALDGFDPFEDYEALLAGGVTTVQISPGANRLMPGQGAVVKLFGQTLAERVLSDSESLRIILTRDAWSPPTVFEPPVGAVSVDRPLEPTRPQLATSLAQAVAGLQAMLAEATEVAGGKETDDLGLRQLAELKKLGRTLRITTGTGAEVRAALQLASQFELPWLLVDPVDTKPLEKVDWSNPLAKGVVFHPEMRPGRIANPSVLVPGQRQEMDVWERTKQLVDRGAAHKLAIRPSSDADLSELLYLAALFGRAGLKPEQVLRMLTANPAEMIGVADRVGTLQPNADADFVVLSGTPLASGSRVMATFVDGQRVYSSPEGQAATVVRAAQVYTPGGVLSDAQISIVGDKIQGVGSSVSAASDARWKDFGNAVIVPGFMDLSTGLGLGGTLGDQLPLNTKLGELLSRDDPQMRLARQGGVTTALLSSSRLPSPVVAFKLGDQPRALKDPVAIRFRLSGNLTAAEESTRRTLRSGKAYADSWKKYEADYAEYEKKLKAYEAAKKKYDAAVKAIEAKKAAAKKAEEEKKAKEKQSQHSQDKSGRSEESNESGDSRKKEVEKEDVEESPKREATSGKQSSGGKEGARQDGDSSEKADDESKTPELKEPEKPKEPKKPRVRATSEPYRDLFAKKTVAIVDVSDARAVEVAVKLFREEFDLRTAVVAGQAAVDRAKLLAKNEVMVVVGPLLVGTKDGKLVNYAAELALAGAQIGFQSRATTGVKELPTAVSYSVYQGLGRRDALRGMSRGPAEFLELTSIGALEAGRDADLVVLSGPPFELSSQVLAVMIDGHWVFEKDSD